MSICRFSTDNWKCDVHVYESDTGYVIHVAAVKPVGEVPPVIPFPLDAKTPEDYAVFVESYNSQMDWLGSCERRPLGLPSDGESYYGLTAEDALDKLKELREEGYRIPDYVFTALQEDVE